MKDLKYLNILVVFLFLGCSSANNQNPTVATPAEIVASPIAGGGTGVLVAGCNFSDRDQNYSSDIVVSGSDNVGQGQQFRAVIYDRSGRIEGAFSVEVIRGSTGSALLETIQSANDAGASFKIEISSTVAIAQDPPAPSTYVSILVHAGLADGSQINNRGLFCSAGR